MTAHLLVLYPQPGAAREFDRAYRQEHLPLAGPKLGRHTLRQPAQVAHPW